MKSPLHRPRRRNQEQAVGDLYFGYGSNLDCDDWARFCRGSGFDPRVLRPVGFATLPGETLVFDYYSNTRLCGALNLRPCVSSTVDGYLFAVSGNGWAVLDVKEGCPHRYDRERVTVIDGSGRRVDAQTYREVERLRQDFVAPNAAYLAACRQGRARYGLSTEQLERAAINAI